MTRGYDIVAMGEILMDFSCSRSGDPRKLAMEGNPGGAPLNVLAEASRLGLRTGFIGKIGNDCFGRFIRDSAIAAGIDTAGLVISEECPTTLAIVSLDGAGNRDFSFYRTLTADIMITPEEVNFDMIRACRLFHFGSVSLSAEPARSATLAAAAFARGNGALVAFDPNLRVALWPDLSEAKRSILSAMKTAGFVKLSEEELTFLSGEDDLERGAASLARSYGIDLLAVTLGAAGCFLVWGGEVFRSEAYDVPCVDTTGAGDAFWGAMLSQILTRDKLVADFDEAEIHEIMDFANAAGSLSTTARGAMPAMPSREQIFRCMSERSRLPSLSQ